MTKDLLASALAVGSFYQPRIGQKVLDKLNIPKTAQFTAESMLWTDATGNAAFPPETAPQGAGSGSGMVGALHSRAFPLFSEQRHNRTVNSRQKKKKHAIFFVFSSLLRLLRRCG
jgi:hypothetical protein